MGGAGVGTRVRVFPDLAAASSALAGHVARRAVAAVADHGTYSLVVSGGRTPELLYRTLAQEYRRKIPWRLTELYFADERCVSPRNPESNYALVAKTLLRTVPIPRRGIHRVRGERSPPSRAAAEYAREISPANGHAPAGARFDTVLLGIGPDGHTASLFPGSATLTERRRAVVSVRSSGLPPYVPRITLTLPALAASSEVCFLVSGSEKAGALARILGSPSGQGGRRLPAARVRSRGEVLWFVDRAAAAELGGRLHGTSVS